MGCCSQCNQHSHIVNQILYDVGDQKTTLASQDLVKYQAEEK